MSEVVSGLIGDYSQGILWDTPGGSLVKNRLKWNRDLRFFRQPFVGSKGLATLHSRRLGGVSIIPTAGCTIAVLVNLGVVTRGLYLYDMGAQIVAPNEVYTSSLGFLSGVPGSCKCTHGWTGFPISRPITVSLHSLFAAS